MDIVWGLIALNIVLVLLGVLAGLFKTPATELWLDKGGELMAPKYRILGGVMAAGLFALALDVVAIWIVLWAIVG